jgi:LTXXQ motif family protein
MTRTGQCRTAILSGLMIALASAAFAQVNMPVPGGGNMMGGMGGGGGGGMPGSCADMMKQGLAITDVQKGAWDAYAAALKDMPSSFSGLKDTLTAAFSGGSGKSSVEQLDAQITAAENRVKALKDLRPKLAALYATLSTDQKKKADQMLATCNQ